MSAQTEYFNRLNYTLANEDTAMELSMLKEGAQHVFSIAGSGGRVLPLLARAPRQITCVDLAAEQLYLTELRFESVRSLDHAEFLAFWGYPPRPASAAERRSLFEKITGLRPEAREFLRNLFEAKQWESILYDGKWEKTFQKLSQAVRALTRSAGAGVFECQTLEEQQEYMVKSFPKKAWAATLFLLGNASVFNALLYHGHFPRKNIPGTMAEFYRERFAKLFKNTHARRNFFLQLCFLGEIRYAEGCPIEGDAQVFSKAKSAIAETQLRYIQADAVGAAQAAETPIDFFSFSDVPSYFSGDQEVNFLQSIRPHLSADARVVIRNYLHVPEGVDSRGYEDVTPDYRSAIDIEKVGVYDVTVLRKI